MNWVRDKAARYEVTYYNRKEMETQTATRRQAMDICPQEADYFLSVSLGIWAFRSDDGRWVEHRDGIWPGFGNTCIKIVRAAQLNVPEFVSPPDIAVITGCETLRSNNALSARWRAIRMAHQEQFGDPHFFLSRRSGGFGVAWNPERSFCWIERIPSRAASVE